VLRALAFPVSPNILPVNEYRALPPATGRQPRIAQLASRDSEQTLEQPRGRWRGALTGGGNPCRSLPRQSLQLRLSKREARNILTAGNRHTIELHSAHALSFLQHASTAAIRNDTSQINFLEMEQFRAS
jgi:hypothetical protein